MVTITDLIVILDEIIKILKAIERILDILELNSLLVFSQNIHFTLVLTATNIKRPNLLLLQNSLYY